MRSQLDSLGVNFDWETSELSTCDPSYYKWTQWIFLQMLKSGLAYQQEAVVNWDPVDQTVLADEQVDAEGRSWRSGALVEKRPLKQWFLKTTNFSKSLLDGLEDPSLEDWRDVVKLQQNWIGVCEGVRLEYTLDDGSRLFSWTKDPQSAPDNVAFLIVPHTHVLNRSENYASADPLECPSVDATGVRLLKQRALNPFRNDSSSCQDIPVYVFPKSCQIFQGVVADMTTMADYAFLGMKSSESNFDYEALCRELGVNPNNTSVSGRSFSDVEQTLEFARSHDIGGHWTSAKLQDWLISRQVCTVVSDKRIGTLRNYIIPK